MIKFIDWSKGKKTYFAVAIALGLGVYQGVTGHQVPEWAYVILGFAGLGFSRSAITAQSATAAQAVEILAQSVLSQISTPEPVLGKPTPAGSDEKAVTDALNAAQLKQ